MVTVPDPEEQNRRGDPPRPDNSADTDAVFASIISGWRAEPGAPRWPAEEERDQPPAAPVQESEPDDGQEGHFEPPEPPPFPVPRPRTLGGVALLAVGVLLLVRPSLLSLDDTAGMPLGLLALTAGIGWLVLGLRTGPPSEGWDDGARL